MKSRQREEGMVGERSLKEERVSSWQLCAPWEGFGSQHKLGYTQQLPGTCPRGLTGGMLVCRRDQFSSVQFSHSVMSDSLRPHGLQHARFPIHHQLPELTYTHVRWVSDAIQPSHPVIPFSRLQSFPASGSFWKSQFFLSGGQSIEVSASTSVLPMNIQDGFPLGWSGWLSLQSKGPSRVFSNTTVQMHRFFSAQLSLQSNSHIHTWLLEKL